MTGHIMLLSFYKKGPELQESERKKGKKKERKKERKKEPKKEKH